LGKSPSTFELKDVSNDNGTVVLETNEAVVKRNDVSGTIKRARTTEMNMHAANTKCLFWRAISQL
jgi:hypothetical protein